MLPYENLSFTRGVMQPSQGMALITALVYLLIISLLVISAFSSGILQTKISEHLFDEKQSFANAESALLVGENAIEIDKTQGQGQINAQATYQFNQIERPECGLYYQVNATGLAMNSKVMLQSVFVFPDGGSNPCTAEPLLPHRVMWYQPDD
jgi:Tfp pilus assembly protein PilX